MKYLFIFLALLSVGAFGQKTSSDEQQFRLVLRNFKTAVKFRNLNSAGQLISVILGVSLIVYCRHLFYHANDDSILQE